MSELDNKKREPKYIAGCNIFLAMTAPLYWQQQQYKQNAHFFTVCAFETNTKFIASVFFALAAIRNRKSK